MTIAQVTSDLKFSTPDGRIILIEANKPYIFPEQMLASIDRQVDSTGKPLIKRRKNLYYNFDAYKGQNLDNKYLVVCRYGGIGDLIFLTPFVERLKKEYPTCKIFLVCNSRIASLFKHLYDGFFAYPIDYNELSKATENRLNRFTSYFISFEGLIENDPKAKERNVYEVIEEHFGLKGSKYLPSIYVDEKLTKEIEKELQDGKIDIGIQFSSSSYIRSWKPSSLVEFLNGWSVENTRFWIFDSEYKKESIDYYLKKVRNPKIELFSLAGRGDIADAASYVVNMDMMIVPDSSLAHIAGVLGIPQVALFGAFHSELRLKYYSNVVALNAMSDCSFAKGKFKSCFEHGTSCSYAMKLNREYSPCMDLITPEIVYSYVCAFLQKLELIKDLPNGINKDRLKV